MTHPTPLTRKFYLRYTIHPDGKDYGNRKYEFVNDCLLSDPSLWEAVLELLRNGKGIDIEARL